MIGLRLNRVLTDTGGELAGQLPGDTLFRSLERDSRQLTAGDLFLAIRGERLDGHAFIDDAAKRGAAAALVARDWASTHPSPPVPLIVVDDTVAALQRLAAAYRAGLDLTVIGVTGSIGKTSTKEVIAAVLAVRFKTYRSPGNLNNEIGLPLSLLELTPETDVAVLEMGGAYALGELTLLADIAQPSIAVVTNVYPVHLERMGTIETIAETKAELVDALPPDGTAILNGDDPRVRAMATRCAGRVLTFGLNRDNDLRATDVVTEALEGTSFWLHLKGERSHLKVPLVGGHAVQLALAALAVGHALGMHVGEMLAGFSDPNIQIRLLVQPGPRGSRIIDDTYNASTPSVLSALGLLEELGRDQTGGRTIAVLGDMRELGSLAEAEHRKVGRRAGEVADLVVTYGDLARLIAAEAESIQRDIDGRTPNVTSFSLDQREELVAFLRRELREGDVVLLKGSRGLLMEEMVVALRADAGADTLPA